MRTIAILMTALVAVSIVPLTDAQPDTQRDAPQAEWVALLQDDEADVRFVGPNADETVPDRFGSFDLVGLRALERSQDIVFELQVRDLEAASEIAYAESADYLIRFTHNDMTYRITASRWTEAGGSGLWGWVEGLDAGQDQDSWSYAGPVSLSQDEAADTITAVVERSVLHDGDGAAPYPGRLLTGFQAIGRHMEINPEDLGSTTPEPSGLVDTMPDEGTGDTDMGFVYGVPQTGDVRISSQKPFRISNGEATTIVYDVLVENIGDDADRFRFSSEDVPEGWTVRFPEPSVTLAAGEDATVRVLATMPFNHEHGKSLSFVMHAISETDDSDAGLELGVLFTEVPQPSGHHSRVWMHSIAWGMNLIGQATAADPGPEHSLAFNTQQEYESDSYESVQSYWSCHICGTESRYWYAFLSPSLGMGLDFDLNKEGLVSLPIESPTPIQGAEVRVVLWHWATDDRDAYDTERIFEASVDAGDWEAGEVKVVEVPFTVKKDADRFDVRQFQGLTLNIWLDAPGLGANAAMEPYISPGGYMDLPLFEYHDPVEAIDDGARTLVVSALGETERFANPGTTVMFPLRVENHGADTKVSLSVTGVHADWAETVPDGFRLEQHGSSEAVLGITVPKDTPDGQLVDLVVEAVADDGRAALQRIRVIVDTDAIHVDEAGQMGDAASKDAPGPGGVLVFVAVALVAMGVLRRRH